MKLSLFLGMTVFAANAASAQVSSLTPTLAAPPSPVIAAPNSNRAYLRVGTEVPLRLVEELTTQGKKLKVGYRVRLETAEPIMVQGVVVIPTGSPAVGEISEVRNKGMWGKSGYFQGRILHANVNGRQIRMSGAFDDKGVAGGVGAAAVSALVFLPAGFFMTGTSARLPAGTIIKGFIDEDVPLEMAAASTAPMVVGAPAAALPLNPAAAPQPTVQPR